MTHGELWVAAAVYYVEHFGFSVIPMSKDKKPLIKWKEFQERCPTVKEILGWPKESLAIVTGRISNLVVVDCESREDAAWFWKEGAQSPMVSQTRCGFHLFFRHPGERVPNAQKIDDRYDVRGDGGYVVCPPSKHKDGKYTWRTRPQHPCDLPVFKMEWRPDSVAGRDYERVISDGEAYVAKIMAVEGEGGDNATFKAACALRDSGMSEMEAMLALQAWNRRNADPQWNEKALLHKIQSAYK